MTRGRRGTRRKTTTARSPDVAMHLRCEYGLLAPEVLEGGCHRATCKTAEEVRTETETGGETGQRALLARGMQEDGDEYQSPPKQSRALNAYGHQGGEGGGYPSPRSACLRRVARGRRGAPRHGSARPKRAAAEWRRRGDPPPSSTRKPRAGKGARGPPQPYRALPQRAARDERRRGTLPSCNVCTSRASRGERGPP